MGVRHTGLSVHCWSGVRTVDMSMIGMNPVNDATVKAVDEQGRVYRKKVTRYTTSYGDVVSFEGPCRYYRDDMVLYLAASRFRIGRRRGLCIDAGGRNHNRSPVWIHRRQVKKAMKQTCESRPVENFNMVEELHGDFHEECGDR